MTETPEPETNTGRCLVCSEPVPSVELLDHLRVMHPDDYGDGPERWPDGTIVVHHDVITPEDFTDGGTFPGDVTL